MDACIDTEEEESPPFVDRFELVVCVLWGLPQPCVEVKTVGIFMLCCSVAVS